MRVKDLKLTPEQAKEICAYLNDHKHCILDNIECVSPLFLVNEIEELQLALLQLDGFPQPWRDLWRREIEDARRNRVGE